MNFTLFYFYKTEIDDQLHIEQLLGNIIVLYFS